MDDNRNHAMWAGPLLAAFGLISYFTIFVRWPSTRDFPWANLLILAAALGVSFLALRRAWPRGGWRRAVSALGVAASSLFAGLLLFYCFIYSARLPAADLALSVGAPVPSLRLLDHNGDPVELAADRERTRILVFYRGHW